MYTLHTSISPIPTGMQEGIESSIQCFGSGSGLGPDSIRSVDTGTDPDLEVKNDPKK
jgi:hypothetical protein